MPSTSSFYKQCEHLFQTNLGYGRRWKSAAAQALGIGRATLYRYFEKDSSVPEDVHARLRELAQPHLPSHDDQEMVSLFARGLVDLQARIDSDGWVKTAEDGYPNSLQRAFDIAGARQAVGGDDRWPTDLASLASLAERPLYQWNIDLSWDPDGDFTVEALTSSGEVTQACSNLAVPGNDPEAELSENRGYRMLINACQDRPDGQRVYTAFRKFVITHPVFDHAVSELATAPVLTSVQRIDEVFDAFYQPVPSTLCIGSSLPICKTSGTILRRWRNGFHTEHRDPRAILNAKAGQHDSRRWRTSTLQLRRAFRRYWCLPGLAEIELAEALEKAGWHCDLWPNFDLVDLAATSPDGRQRIAVDVKDYLSPGLLAARVGDGGFGQYAETHTCRLVIPNYLPEVVAGYERRFASVRAARGSTSISLRTVSGLMDEVTTRS